jgi:predicted O-methyltransferase YrrM
MQEGVVEKFNISDVCKKRSIQDEWGELIFKIIRDFKPLNCLELGTCLGISAAYQISALKLNGHGKFTTIEGSEILAKHSDINLRKLKYQDYLVHNGRFSDVLPKILSEDHPIDFAFIDGHHDKEATQRYFELLYPFLSEKAILIFDDINWSEGMKEVWKHLYENGEGVIISFDFHKWGICVIDKKSKKKEKYYHQIAL